MRREYETYLKEQRGLADSTIYDCMRLHGRFLTYRFGVGTGDLNAITPNDVTSFILDFRRPENAPRDKTCPSHLRNFFKFLFWSGRTKRGLAAFRALRAEVDSHRAIVTGAGRTLAEHPEFRWVNILLGNLKNALTGTYHAFKFAQYAPRYLADFQYRFNRRYNLRSILPRLLRAAATTGPWTEQRVTAAELCT